MRTSVIEMYNMYKSCVSERTKWYTEDKMVEDKIERMKWQDRRMFTLVLFTPQVISKRSVMTLGLQYIVTPVLYKIPSLNFLNSLYHQTAHDMNSYTEQAYQEVIFDPNVSCTIICQLNNIGLRLGLLFYNILDISALNGCVVWIELNKH